MRWPYEGGGGGGMKEPTVQAVAGLCLFTCLFKSFRVCVCVCVCVRQPCGC